MANSDIKITDWIQSIGSIVAITGTIVGFIFLILEGKDQDNQLRQLTRLAESAQKQALSVQQQVAIMDSQNHILLKQLAQDIDVEKSASKTRLNNIRPYINGKATAVFLLKDSVFRIELLFENFASDAQKLTVNYLDDSNKFIGYANKRQKGLALMKTNELWDLCVLVSEKDLPGFIRFIFQDIDGNCYEQKHIIAKPKLSGASENGAANYIVSIQTLHPQQCVGKANNVN